MKPEEKKIKQAILLLDEALALIADDGDDSDTIDFWGGGNVWKPEDEHKGLLVVMLQHTYDAHTVEAKRKDGTYESLQYSGRANGDRQHWRGNLPGSGYAGKQGDGKVIISEEKGRTVIAMPGKPKERWG